MSVELETTLADRPRVMVRVAFMPEADATDAVRPVPTPVPTRLVPVADIKTVRVRDFVGMAAHALIDETCAVRGTDRTPCPVTPEFDATAAPRRSVRAPCAVRLDVEVIPATRVRLPDTE